MDLSELTSQIISHDTMLLFLQTFKDAILLGLLFGIIIRITWWLWK